MEFRRAFRRNTQLYRKHTTHLRCYPLMLLCPHQSILCGSVAVVEQDNNRGPYSFTLKVHLQASHAQCLRDHREAVAQRLDRSWTREGSPCCAQKGFSL